MDLTRIMRSPGKYVQGPGALAQLPGHIADLGSRALLIATASGKARVEETLRQGGGESFPFATLEGECCIQEVERLGGIFRAEGCDVVVGIGGGKVLDTAKAVAYFEQVPVVIVPTAASSDAPCSALSVLYKQDGEFDRYLFLRQSPQLVLVDTGMIARAPARLLAAGMGDALATYFEARAVRQSGKDNQVGGKPTLAATLLATQCYKTLLRDGEMALLAARAHRCTPAFENIVEINTYLSGVGFESGGLGAAHAYQKGFTTIPRLKSYHGEIVAFGTIAQLVLENAPEEELRAVVEFCIAAGLPVTFADLGIPDVTEDELLTAAEFSTRPGMTIHNMPFETGAQDALAALCTANEVGAHYRSLH